jgi:sugar lactone lactonase YvrE
MHKMQQQGLSYDFNQTEDSQNIRDTQAYDYINNLMIEAGKPGGDGAIAMTLPGDPAEYRAMAWDKSRDRLLVGTVSKGQVLAVDADGGTEVLLQADSENGLWSVNGLAVDHGRGRLWVSSAATPEFAAYTESDGNRNALFEFDLETLTPLVRHDLPPDGFYHELGGVAVTDDGHVYVVDTVTPVIYWKAPQRAGLEPFVASKELVAFTDVAVTPDNSLIFASDPVMGIFIVDPSAQSAAMLSGPETLNLGGIQSVEYVDGNLFIVQAGIQPERLVRLALDANGFAVTDVVPMAVALEAFDRPGAGTVTENDYYYFANPGSGEAAPGSVVMRTRLDAGNALKSLDIQDLQEALKPREP